MGRISDRRKSEEVSFRKLERQRLLQKRRKAQRDIATAHQRGEIPLDYLVMDCGTQSRAVIDTDTVERYADAMREGAKFPAITVYFDGENYLLADGFHRVAAAQDVGLVTFPADVRQGTLREAILHSLQANTRHGLPRTRSDVDRCIIRMLDDEEWSRWSDREIARRVGCSHVTVGKKRASLFKVTSDVPTERSYVDRYGHTNTMNTANIGAAGRTNDRPAAPQHQPVVVRPSLPKDTPAEIAARVDAGQLSPMTAIWMADKLRDVAPEVQEVALRLPLDGKERIGILADLYATRQREGSNATFDEIASSGGFHYGDEMDQWIDFSAAPLGEVFNALKSVSRNHARIAAEAQAYARSEAAKTAAPQGKHRCLVIDPPWPMKFIERDARPQQGLYPDYPDMSLEEIAKLPIPDLAHDDGCHLYLWTTQKFLPDALQLVSGWGFGYRCLLTWVKPTGMTPYSFMFNTEHVIYAVRGNLPLERLGRKLSFEAASEGHSIKPDVFYKLVAEVSPGPRLDMFARQSREGFMAWGYEAPAADREVSHA